MVCNEQASGFVKPDDILKTGQFTDFSILPSRGYSLLVRAKRHGRWWMLKGLKEPYRNDTVYQVLLQKEYEITSQLQHPMIVSVFSLEEVEGLGLCIVMEWIEGLTLKEWLAQGKHSRKQRRHVADMLLEALAYVQSRQTQHRDLKPSNIMITHDGQHLKLIDFGLADTDSHTILKAPAGTEGYMAPDRPSDIYSLGCILRQLRLGWLSRMVISKCCAPNNRRYTDTETIKKDLHRCWQWPKRILLIISLAFLMTGFYLFNHSRTQQEPRIQYEQTKTDTLQLQINKMNERIESNREIKDKAKKRINEAKKQIDKQMHAYGIQQMLDTVTCQQNITIPFLRITDELIKETKEPELKEYIQERYRKPWLKRMSELPFE
jgi:serine/threonine protein kinase